MSDLCRREVVHPTIYYKWLKDFIEAGKGRLHNSPSSLTCSFSLAYDGFLGPDSTR